MIAYDFQIPEPQDIVEIFNFITYDIKKSPALTVVQVIGCAVST